MLHRPFGRTGLQISALGFGCGSVGGLIIRGSERVRTDAVARALAAGITYFDTAAAYGDGKSEENLGQIWKVLKPDALVGTKFSLAGDTDQSIGERITGSLDASLARLAMDRVDLFQLHNPIASDPGEKSLSPDVVINEVGPALETLKAAGKVGFGGFTAIGDTDAILEVIDTGLFDAVQIVFNMLNPSSAFRVGSRFHAQDYRGIMNRAAAAGMGTLGIRILAGGALSAADTRHPTASPMLDPIGSAASYEGDVANAQALLRKLESGAASDPIGTALRFAAHQAALHCSILGCSSLDQLVHLLSAFDRGPLPEETIDRILDFGGLADQ